MGCDDLAHTLSFLGPKELAVAAQVSRHFRHVIPDVVRIWLNRLATDHEHEGVSYFKLRHSDECTPELLQRVQEDYKFMPKLIAKLKPRNRKKHDLVLDQIDGLHDEVKYLFHKDLWAKLEQFAGVEGLANARESLLRLLLAAEIPNAELCETHRTELIAAELKPPKCRSHFNYMPAFSLMEQTSPAVIERHKKTLLWWLTKSQDLFGEGRALDLLSQMTPEKVAEITAELETIIVRYRGKRGSSESSIRKRAVKMVRVPSATLSSGASAS